jgi:Ger(x)C family germination protein
LDENKEGDIEAYQELFKAKRGYGQELGKEVKLNYKATGKTAFEALMDTSLNASEEIDDSQIKAIIFSEKAAKDSMGKFLDYFVRSQKPTVRMYMFIYEGDNPNELMSIKSPEEEFLGLYLHSMMISNNDLIHLQSLKLNEYKNEKNLGAGVALIPIIQETDKESMKIEIEGAAIIKGDKMVGRISKDDLKAYRLATKNGIYGHLIVKRPDNHKGYVTLRIIDTKVNMSIKYDGKNIIINKNVEIDASLVSSQYDDFNYNKQLREKIQNRAERQVSKKCTNVFNKYQKKNIDLYNITRKVEAEYPHLKKKENELLKMMKIGKVNVSVNILGSNNHIENK